ncbi:hypothetical protein V3C99_014378 [Haemonchus contortus]|uniref:Reverse transcriptase domain-containing protein n=1 Tax=Haemonchus contortus TaxID=6289 RepID=A0A7I4YU48_HAECO
MPLCLTLIDLKKAFDTDETEAVIEAQPGRHLLITPNIEEVEQVLAEFDSTFGKIGLKLILTKTMFMKNGLVPDAPSTPDGSNIFECYSHVHLGRNNMMNDLALKLCRRQRAAWGAFKNIKI